MDILGSWMAMRPWNVTRLMPVVDVAALLGMGFYVVREESSPIRESLARLRSADRRERAEAILELSQRGKEDLGRAVPALVRSLHDKDANVRANAARALSVVPPGDPLSAKAAH